MFRLGKTTIEQTAKTHYAYAMATKMIGKKPTFLMKKWIADVEAGCAGAGRTSAGTGSESSNWRGGSLSS